MHKFQYILKVITIKIWLKNWILNLAMIYKTGNGKNIVQQELLLVVVNF